MPRDAAVLIRRCPLKPPRDVAAMGMLNISLNMANNWPWQTGWKLLGPTG